MSDSNREKYQELTAAETPDALERALLDVWDAEGLFDPSFEAKPGQATFVFYEGPPTANGRPGIHHVFARTLKDLIPRHRAMKGFHITRKAGWDTHGLPVEIEVEKALGISGKRDIEAIGVAEFNRRCRDSVFTYRGDWEKLSKRMAYWLDYERPYVTYSNDYVESVWWALSTMFTKGLLTQGHKILPYCPRCETALSSHEVAQGYKDVEDPSTYIALDLDDASSAMRRRILVWTTTPWTLVSNAALAVHPDLDYVELQKKTGAEFTVILAESRVAAVLGADWADRWVRVRALRGSELVGMRYARPLDWVEYPDDTNHEIIVGEPFVSADDGTGVVHMAPAFGADDYGAGQRHNLSFIQPVDARGRFPESMPIVGGRFIKDADPLIVDELKRRDVLWKDGRFVHSYPHCWRCGTPLLYYARGSWFVKTTAIKDDMIARNAQVQWQPPEVGSGRFGQWLENNVDWAVSRDRYWGTPLPVWINDADPTEIEVIGGFAHLAERVGRALPEDFDPHKPYIDAYTWPAASGTGTMRRVPEVIDAWFDSGSMPFAQWHYPFENADVVAGHFPADYICEGVDQTRGWFYSLLAVATALGDALPNNAAGAAAPFRHVLVNDLVLDANGLKMSKSKGNAVDPWRVIATHGVDAVRLFLISTSQVWIPRRFDEDVLRQTAGRFLVTLRNTYSGIFAQYANLGWSPSDRDPAISARPALDRWVLSRLATVEADADRLLEAYEPTLAARVIMEFVDDDISNWYVRQSRSRFWDTGSDDSRAAFATLHDVLTIVCRLLAPFAPFLTDWMHRQLVGSSVHTAAYTRGSGASARDAALERDMAAVRTLCRLGRAAREEAGIKVRQPLGRLVCVVPRDEVAGVQALAGLIASELNVKTVVFAGSADDLVRVSAKGNFRVLGKRFGKATPAAAAAIESLTSAQLQAFERGERVTIVVDGVEHALEPDDVVLTRSAAGDLVVASDGVYVAAVDPLVTGELRREGIARELVSRVQRIRKDAGLAVSDRIRLIVGGVTEVREAAREHHVWIAGEVLATVFEVEDSDTTPPVSVVVDLDGLAAWITLERDVMK
ncbi:MAG: isoleucine--tRNA ligase [Gemmatimonadaceae bacterium]|nr:isoleucine--tRNA ligase [Gemmatimonadaceae bacterium]